MGGGFGRLDALFEIERAIAGQPPEQRLAVRTEKSAPQVADLEAWIRSERGALQHPPVPPRPGRQGDRLHAQALDRIHPLSRRWPTLLIEQASRSPKRSLGKNRRCAADHPVHFYDRKPTRRFVKTGPNPRYHGAKNARIYIYEYAGLSHI